MAFASEPSSGESRGSRGCDSDDRSRRRPPRSGDRLAVHGSGDRPGCRRPRLDPSSRRGPDRAVRLRTRPSRLAGRSGPRVHDRTIRVGSSRQPFSRDGWAVHRVRICHRPARGRWRDPPHAHPGASRLRCPSGCGTGGPVVGARLPGACRVVSNRVPYGQCVEGTGRLPPRRLVSHGDQGSGGAHPRTRRSGSKRLSKTDTLRETSSPSGTPKWTPRWRPPHRRCPRSPMPVSTGVLEGVAVGSDASPALLACQTTKWRSLEVVGGRGVERNPR